MSLSMRQLESLVLFLATHGRVWTAHCASMSVNGEQIARELTREHGAKLQQATKTKP